MTTKHCHFEYRLPAGGEGRVQAASMQDAARLARATTENGTEIPVLVRCLSAKHCGHPPQWSSPTESHEPDRSRAPRADVELTTIGVVFDHGLSSEGLPEEQWHEHAVGALSDALGGGWVTDQCLVTLSSEQWEDESAHEVAEVALATGVLMAEVSFRGAQVFTSLTSPQRQALLGAAECINRVQQEIAGTRQLPS